MNEQYIRGCMKSLGGAIDNQEEKIALAATLELLTIALIDLHRIANALEKHHGN